MESQRPFFNGTINYRYAADPYAEPVNLNSRLGTPNGAGDIAAPDYTVAGAGQDNLSGKLIDFFGQALGCSGYLTSAAGWTMTGFNPDMEAVHRGMPITSTIFTEFVTAVTNAASANGFTVTEVDTVSALLNSFVRGSFTTAGNIPTNAGTGLDYAPNKVIRNIAGNTGCDGEGSVNTRNLQCTADSNIVRGTQSICQWYAASGTDHGNDAVNQYRLVKALVTRAILGNSTGESSLVNVPGLVKAGSPTLTFFDGTTNSRANGGSVNNNHPAGSGTASPNYLANPDALNYLVDHLVSFFGSALGCTGYAFPAYTGVTSMKAVHAGMQINAAVFNYFNEQVALSAKSYGVSDDDVTTVAGVLGSFGRATAADGVLNDASICNQDGCPCQTGYSGNTCTATAAAGGVTAGSGSSSSTANGGGGGGGSSSSSSSSTGTTSSSSTGPNAASSIQAFSFAGLVAVLLAMVVRA
jgi:hypothetical protein